MLLGANMNGSEKLIIPTIWKLLKSWCMKNLNLSPPSLSLSLLFMIQIKCGWWQICERKSVRWWDRKFWKQSRNIAVVADYCTTLVAWNWWYLFFLKQYMIIISFRPRHNPKHQDQLLKASSKRHDHCNWPHGKISSAS